MSSSTSSSSETVVKMRGQSIESLPQVDPGQDNVLLNLCPVVIYPAQMCDMRLTAGTIIASFRNSAEVPTRICSGLGSFSPASKQDKSAVDLLELWGGFSFISTHHLVSGPLLVLFYPFFSPSG